jgi:hypothetical protein
MRDAVETSGASDADREALLAYFEMASTSLINQPFDSRGEQIQLIEGNASN